jgi:hypothetical protein
MKVVREAKVVAELSLESVSELPMEGEPEAQMVRHHGVVSEP